MLRYSLFMLDRLSSGWIWLGTLFSSHLSNEPVRYCEIKIYEETLRNAQEIGTNISK